MIENNDDIVNLLGYFFESSINDNENDSNSVHRATSNLQINLEQKEDYNEVKLAIVMSLERFLKNASHSHLKFPTSLSPRERTLVKIASEKLGLKYYIYTPKKYKQQSRVIVYKDDIKELFTNTISFALTSNSRKALSQFLVANPVTVKERQEFPPKGDNDLTTYRSAAGKMMGASAPLPLSSVFKKNLPRVTLNTSSKTAADHRNSSGSSDDDLRRNKSRNSGNIYLNSLDEYPRLTRKPTSTHVIWQIKNDILKSLKKNQFVIVFGAPRSGKTTQIAEMIIEDGTKHDSPCRIFCAQPYRLCPIVNANFMSNIRQENIGQTVGYQIKLESKSTSRTSLIYCTNEVLLRSLHSDKNFLKGATHIIIDEMQERSEYTDLLLAFLTTKLQSCNTYNHVKVMLLVTTPTLPADISVSSGCKVNSYYDTHFSSSVKSAAQAPIVATTVAHAGPVSKPNELGCIGVLPIKYAELIGSLRKYFKYSTTLFVRKPTQHIDEIFLQEILNLINSSTTIVTDPQVSQNDILSQKQAVDKWFYDFWLMNKEVYTGVGGGNVNSLGLFEVFCQSYIHNSQLQKTQNSNSNSNVVNTQPMSLSFGFSSIQHQNLIKSYQQPSVQNKNKNMDAKSMYEELLLLIFSRSDMCDCADYIAILRATNIATSTSNETKLDNGDYQTWDDVIQATENNNSSGAKATITNYPTSGMSPQNCFKQLFNFIINDIINVNYRHRNTGMTALMICAFRGFKQAVKQLLELGGDPLQSLPISNWFSTSYRAYQNHLFSTEKQVENLLNIINQYGKVHDPFPTLVNNGGNSNTPNISCERNYYPHLMSHDLAIISQSFELADLIVGKLITKLELTDIPKLQTISNASSKPVNASPFANFIDEKKFPKTNNNADGQPLKLSQCNNLINDSHLLLNITANLLRVLIQKAEHGNILVFLPDYDHLCQLKIRVTNLAETLFPNTHKFTLFLLHEDMVMDDLNDLLYPKEICPRKVILSTCIGESCINIPDVSYVIDMGLETKSMYDNVLKTYTHKTTYISKYQAALRASNATNQARRVCFHIYTRGLFDSLEETMSVGLLHKPLHDIFLHIKLLLPNIQMSVNEFIDKMLEKPKIKAITESKKLLEALHAIDCTGSISCLGRHLHDFPIDPKYGKMVLYGIFLKCLDPIITIVCALSLSSFFLQPNSSKMVKEINEIKRKFACKTYSDHMVLLRVFQFWQLSCTEGMEKVFCETNHLYSSVLERITVIRTKLLDQLKASGFIKTRGAGDIQDLNVNSDNWAVIKAAIVAGTSILNFCHFEQNNGIMVTGKSTKVKIHDLSTLHHLNDLKSARLTAKDSSNSNSLNNPKSLTNLYVFNQSLSAPTFNVAHTQTDQGFNNSVNVSAKIQQQMTDTNVYSLHSATTNEIEYVKNVTMVTPITVVLMNSKADLHNSADLIDEEDIASNAACFGGFEDVSSSSDDDFFEDESEKRKRKSQKKDKQETDSSIPASLSFLVPDGEIMESLTHLKLKWKSYVDRRIRFPTKLPCIQDEHLLHLIVTILTNEETSYGIQQPMRVEVRPKPMGAECSNYASAEPILSTEIPTDSTVISAPDNTGNNTNSNCASSGMINMASSAMMTNPAFGGELISYAGAASNPLLPYANIDEHATYEDWERTCVPTGSNLDPSKIYKYNNYFFAVKLKNDEEMIFIYETQSYHVSMSFKNQIEYLLMSGYNIFLIFIDEITYSVMGVSRVIYVDQPIPIHQPTFDSLSRTDGLLYAIKLEVSVDKYEDLVSGEIMANIVENLGNLCKHPEHASKTIIVTHGAYFNAHDKIEASNGSYIRYAATSQSFITNPPPHMIYPNPPAIYFNPFPDPSVFANFPPYPICFK